MADAADVRIRRATLDDLYRLGQLGAALVRAHHAFDRRRFIEPGRDPVVEYGEFLRQQILTEDAEVLVAERDGRIVGYVFAALEPRSWKELREACAFIDDVVVEEASRAAGVGTALVTAALDWARGRGAPRVILWTATPNDRARQLFARLGFRETMREMTREL